MNTITITEDQSLAKGEDFHKVLKDYLKQGYTIQNKYNHPAVGIVVTLIKK